MTREQILENYNVEHGRIVSPGQFEGEMVYVPYFWEMFLDGFADNDDGEVITFKVDAHDRRHFPELPKSQRTVKLVRLDSGFVCEIRPPTVCEV
jgi:hypothetical protein